ncbi:MAG: hypothetical protein PHV36_07525 [Elusimicrobiales bacterium]|nr:hypothetical protein [Elusimicrobiales bacterium]
MINNIPAVILSGAALGTLSGWGSRLAMKRVLNSSDKIFYLVFTTGFFLRFALLLGGICMLRHQKVILIVSFTVSFILVQMAFEAFPLKKNGIKRNT